MNSLATWMPTIITGIGWIFALGILWNKVQSHDKRIDSQEERHDELTKAVGAQAVSIGKLESWKEGWAAARSMYDHTRMAAGG